MTHFTRILQHAQHPIVFCSRVFGVTLDAQFVLGGGRIDKELEDFAALVGVQMEQSVGGGGARVLGRR